MRDIIIDAGRRLGDYWRGELGGRMTASAAKTLSAVATDILPGERYEAVRNMLALGARYGLLAELTNPDENERLKVNNAIYTLTTRGLMADGFARMAVALFLVMLNSSDAEVLRCERLIDGGLVSELYSSELPSVVETVEEEEIPPEFRVEDGILIRYLGDSETVNVPRGIKEIGARAFGKKSGIKSVNLPEGITAIGTGAFLGCLNLARISLPDSLERIGAHAFFDCRRLEAANLPRGLCSLGSYAFSECAKLKTVDIPRGVTSLPQGVFCRSGITGVKLPTTLKSIGESAFFGTKIKKIELPEGLLELGEKAFSGCGSLKEASVPGSVEILGNSSFALCFSLKTITLAEGIREIGERALSGCISLRSIDLPGSIKYIAAHAFENDHALVEIRLHGKVASSSTYAFSGCSAKVINK
ncbi:MAG: leucine-rich repeat domain-containing protein [Clostridia bacterium]|nr:leucine-rich repeat domain-containing protein [Clostridia bacterium]